MASSRSPLLPDHRYGTGTTPTVKDTITPAAPTERESVTRGRTEHVLSRGKEPGAYQQHGARRRWTLEEEDLDHLLTGAATGVKAGWALITAPYSRMRPGTEPSPTIGDAVLQLRRWSLRTLRYRPEVAPRSLKGSDSDVSERLRPATVGGCRRVELWAGWIGNAVPQARWE